MTLDILLSDFEDFCLLVITGEAAGLGREGRKKCKELGGEGKYLDFVECEILARYSYGVVELERLESVTQMRETVIYLAVSHLQKGHH